MPLVIAIIHFIAALGLTWLINQIGLISWKRAAAAHWAERARRLWPVRYTSGLTIFIVPVTINLWYQSFQSQTFPGWISGLLAGFAGGLLGNYPVAKTVYPQLDFKSWWRQIIIFWGLRLTAIVPLGIAVGIMPEHFGRTTLLVAGGYLAVHVLLQWGLLFKFLRWMKCLRPAGQRLQSILDASAASMGAKVQATWQLASPAANALAFPRTKQLVFTDRLLEICDDQEIAAICAHELAHLLEPKTVLAVRIIGSFGFFPLIFLIPCVCSFGLAGFLPPYLTMFFMLFLVRRFSQRMEKRADLLATGQQADHGVYARALEKLYQANQIPAVNVSNRQTHPHLYDRLLAAGITPDFPRPAPPKRVTWIGWVMLVLFGLGIFRAVAAG